jgi:hypothetical protein
MDEAASVTGTIDVFLESDRANAETETTSTTLTYAVRSYMDMFKLSLLGCWRHCRTSCYVRNLRFHSVDARKFKSAYLMIYGSCHSLLYDKKPRGKDEKRNLLRQLDGQVLQTLRDGVSVYAESPELTVRDIISYHVTSSKAMKQIEKIPDEDDRRLVMDMIVRQTLEKHSRVADMRLQDVLSWIDLLDPRLFDFMDGFSDIGMIPMDLYAMGRLLSTFRDGSSAQRSLFFVGWVHAVLYEKILHSLRFTRVWTSPRRRDGSPVSMDQYLDVSGAPQPFLR